MIRIFVVFCVLIICLFGLSGCSSSKTTYYLYDCVEKNGVYYYFDINEPEMTFNYNLNCRTVDIVQFPGDPNYYYAITYENTNINAVPYYGSYSGLVYIPISNYYTKGKKAILISDKPYNQLSYEERKKIPLYKTDRSGAAWFKLERSGSSVIKYFTVNEK